MYDRELLRPDNTCPLVQLLMSSKNYFFRERENCIRSELDLIVSKLIIFSRRLFVDLKKQLLIPIIELIIYI